MVRRGGPSVIDFIVRLLKRKRSYTMFARDLSGQWVPMYSGYSYVWRTNRSPDVEWFNN
jgi:hypothetical protein